VLLILTPGQIWQVIPTGSLLVYPQNRNLRLVIQPGTKFVIREVEHYIVECVDLSGQVFTTIDDRITHSCELCS